MSAHALVLMADPDSLPLLWLADAKGFDLTPGPATSSSYSCAIAADRVADFVAALRERSPMCRIAVHVSLPDAIGYSHTARILHRVEAGHTLLSSPAVPFFSSTIDLGVSRIPGTLRRVRLHALDPTCFLSERPRLPDLPGVAVAREQDLRALMELVSFGIRAITLSGRPGVGKTHLMVRLAHRLVRSGRCPVFLDLSGHTAYGALAALGRELGIPIDGRLGSERILSRLAAGITLGRPDVIMLDHVPEAALPSIAELIRRTSVCWILCGVRSLGVGSKVTYELHPIRSTSQDVLDSTALLMARAPQLEQVAGALVSELDGAPLAIELVAGWVLDHHPLAVFEWLAERSRSLPELVEVAFEALPQTLRERLLQLSVWPDALGVSTNESDVRELIERGWLRVNSDLAVPGLPSVHLHPQLRSLLLERHSPPEESLTELYGWMATQSEALGRMLHGSREPSVFDVVSAWVPTLDAILSQLLTSNPLSSANLAYVAPVLELRVACGTRLGSVDRVIEGLEKALQGAGARFDLDPLVVVRLFQARGEAFLHRREWQRARADFDRAFTLAERRGEILHQARLCLLLARVAMGSERYDLAETWLDKAQGLVPEDALWRGEIPALQGRLFSVLGRHEEALAALDRASIWSAAGAPSLRASIFSEQALSERRSGNRAASAKAYSNAVAAWGAAGRPELEAAALFQLALVEQSEGRLSEAMTLLEQVEERTLFSGEDARRGLVISQRALILLEKGALSAAHRTLIEALSASRLGGDRAGQGTAKGFMALAQQLQGNRESARDGYRSALRDLESGQDRRYGALFHCLLGVAEAELGNLGEARILLDMATLRLADAEPAMREAIGLFQLAVGVAESGEGQGDAKGEALRKVREALDAIEDRSDNIYLRFARRYLYGVVKESA